MTLELSLTPIQVGYENGDRLIVKPVVENTSNSQTTDTVSLKVDTDEKDSRKITLDAGQTQRVKLAWDVSVNSNKQATVTIETAADSVSDDATLREYDDTVRYRFEPSGDSSTYVVDATDIGQGT